MTSRSRLLWTLGVAVAVVVLLVEIEPPDLGMREPSGRPDSDLITDASIEPGPEAVIVRRLRENSGLCVLRLKDRLTEKLLPGVKISFGTAAKISVSDPSGKMFGVPEEALRERFWSVSLPPELGGATKDIKPSTSLGDPDHSGVRDLKLMAYARLKLHPQWLGDGAMEDVQLRVESIPPLPIDRMPNDTRIKALRMARLQLPGAYSRALRRMKLGELFIRGEPLGHASEGDGRVRVFDIPWQGEVAIFGRLDGCSPLVQRVIVVPGEEYSCPLYFRERPTVRGVVRIDGQPRAGVSIEIKCFSEFELTDSVPAVKEAGGGAIATWQNPGDSSTKVLLTHRVKSGKNGQFSVRVPFTDRVACTAILQDRFLGVTRTAAAGRYQDCDGVQLDIRTSLRASRIRIVSSNESPLSQTMVTIRERGDVFHIEYPAATTSSDGWIDSSAMSPGQEYVLWQSGKGFVRFHYEPGMTVAFK